MDRLTAIKIKYEDGTYSDEIPIYVTAENVEYNDEYNLIETLGYIDVKKDGTIQEQINKITSISARIPTLDNRIANIQGGTPTVVDSISDMIDTDQIYILSTDSKWYYYDLTSAAWVAGGAYGGVPTDTTLTQSGMAADAKKTGDELTDLKGDLTHISKSVFDSEMVDTKWILSKTNKNVTDNGDGTYTIGTGDYGTVIFGRPITLKAGVYKLFGVPEGFSFLSSSISYEDAFITNDKTDAILVEIVTDVECYLGYRNTKRPSAEFIITPYLLGKTEKDLNVNLKETLLNVFSKVAYIDANGQDYYDQLENALYPLPNEYTRVKYLYSDATDEYTGSYINTDIVFNNPTTAEIKIKFMGDEGNAATKYPVGVREKGTGIKNNVGWGLHVASNSITLMSWSGAPGAVIVPSAPYIKHSIKATWASDRVTIQEDSNEPVVSIQSTRLIDQYPICLFGIKPAASTGSEGIYKSYFFRGYVYYAEAKEDGKTIMKVYPCVRKSDNAVGMYDIISNSFYTPYSVNGGTITAGPTI